ncbi:hypothetical protein OEZ85_000971 [Tetradesmus obliquus]|uniref:Uncharacterized protein n=1 Tax=Tetradesmus obliquus TaxID=3088 RepID=A0ABY8UN41_TETOB|nr:hypothetical protein OEZ85_000971 [Tetradesmus obliquus]
MSQQRLQSGAGASCSSRCSSLRPTLLPRNAVLARARGALLVSARVVTAPKVVYMPNFLSKEDAAAIRKEALSLQPQLRPELNCIAEGRLGCYLGGPRSPSLEVFSRQATAAALTQVRDC